MLYQSQNVTQISTILAYDKLEIVYRFANNYGVKVISVIDNNDLEMSVLAFNGEDIMDHVSALETEISGQVQRTVSSDVFFQTMLQIEELSGSV